jgi:hypothetical protein
MALYINIARLADRGDQMEYTYSIGVDRSGRLMIDKSSGEVTLMERAPGEGDAGYFERAGYKVRQAWEAGELPDVLCWAS